jgi:hypothetical protein
MASAGYHRPSSSRRPTQRRVPEELEASATLAVGADFSGLPLRAGAALGEDPALGCCLTGSGDEARCPGQVVIGGGAPVGSGPEAA